MTCCREERVSIGTPYVLTDCLWMNDSSQMGDDPRYFRVGPGWACLEDAHQLTNMEE